MGKTSAKVKNAWNAEHYEIIRFAVYKGDKEKYQDRAAAVGLNLSEYIRTALEEYFNKPLQ